MTTQTTLAEKFVLNETHVIEPDVQVNAARFTSCGRFLIAGGFVGDIHRWQWNAADRTATSLSALESPGAWVAGLACHPSAPTLWSGDSWGNLTAWRYDTDDGEKLWSVEAAHDGWLRQIAVSGTGERIATCGRDRTVREWSTEEGTCLRELAHDQDVLCVAYDAANDALVTGDDRGMVRRYDLDAAKPSQTFDASVLYLYHRIQDVGGVRALALDSAGRFLAVGGTTPKNGATVQGTPTILLFNPSNGELLKTLTLGESKDCYVHDIRFHDAGFLIAVTSGTPGTGQILFHDLAADEPFLRHTKVPNCHAASLHPSEPLLAVTATNRRSNGNGRRLDDEGNYIGNSSPIHIFELQA